MRISIFIYLLLIYGCRAPYSALSLSKPYKNFVQISSTDQIYISKYETTNLEYDNFIENIRFSNPGLRVKCRVDSMNWIYDFKSHYNDPMVRTYHEHTAFDNYPVVNVTHYGAMQYCLWLTNFYAVHNQKNKFRFRLPKNQEYTEDLNSLTIDYSSDKAQYYDRFDFNLVLEDNYSVDGAAHLAPVFWYAQNPQRISSIIGNASELTESGDLFGGNWHMQPSESTQFLPFTKSETGIGFRIIMEKL